MVEHCALRKFLWKKIENESFSKKYVQAKTGRVIMFEQDKR